MDNGANYHVTLHIVHLNELPPIGMTNLHTCIGVLAHTVSSIGTTTLHTHNSKLLLHDVLLVPESTN